MCHPAPTLRFPIMANSFPPLLPQVVANPSSTAKVVGDVAHDNSGSARTCLWTFVLFVVMIQVVLYFVLKPVGVEPIEVFGRISHQLGSLFGLLATLMTAVALDVVIKVGTLRS